MKKLLLLTAYCSIAFTQDAVSSPEPEQNAKQAIESFMASPEITLSIEENSLPQTSPDVEYLPTSAPTVQLDNDAPTVSLSPPPSTTDALPEPSIVAEVPFDPVEEIAAIEKEESEVAAAVNPDGIIVDLGQVLAGSPTIYTILLCLSIASVGIWAYTLLNLRTPQLIPQIPLENIREKLLNHQYDEALALCHKRSSILFQMIATGIQARHQDSKIIRELMKAEGQRASSTLWQKIGLLNDIAVIAPMLGLLGTVLGMFYAFYDLNRSMESISALFDGLGISVGTTLGGLFVAILALIFHSMTKYRLMRQLTAVESEAQSFTYLIDKEGKA